MAQDGPQAATDGPDGAGRTLETGPFAEGALVDHFKVIRHLGHGGMGEIFLARDTKLGRKVALKVIRPQRLGSVEAVQRFVFEARVTARFNHPNIITIFAVGEHAGFPYLALEYLEGQSLRTRMAQERLGAGEAARFGLAVAEALAEAHHHEILHRDLKPANIVIPRDGRLRVLDFGLAKPMPRGPGASVPDPRSSGGGGSEPIISPFESADANFRGTPSCMAPEQWREEEVTAATDVWALGLLLHEMVTGRHPYQDQLTTATALALDVCSGRPVPLAESLGQEAGGLEELIRRCLAKTPGERPSAREAAEQLQRYVTRQHRSGLDESPFRGLEPFGERHAAYFFGRDAEIDAFIERLRVVPVLPVVGPSGAGKSSFIQAGVVPRLREQRAWTVLTLRPGSRPFVTLAGRLRGAENATRLTTSGEFYPGAMTQDIPTGPGDPLALRLRDEPHTLTLHLLRIAEHQRSSVLLFVDQLEELFSMVEDDGERRAFLQAICTAADDPAAPVRVAFTVRDDFLGKLALGQEIREVLGQMTVLRSPGSGALQEILSRPVDAAGYRYDDPELIPEMVESVQGEAASLPLLQFTAGMLWERRDVSRRLLLRAAYDAMGGVGGALAEHADGVLEEMTGDQVVLARQMLLRLVVRHTGGVRGAGGGTVSVTRRVLPKPRVLEGLGPGAAEVLDRLAGSRLITVRRGRGMGDREAVLEIVHESLIRNWGRLARWIEESSEDLAFLQEVGQAAELWLQRGRRADEVWQGDALHEALRSLAKMSANVPAPVEEFLIAGARLEEARTRRRRLLTIAGVSVLALVALVLVVVNLQLGNLTDALQDQKLVAERGRAAAQREGARAALARGNLLEARAKVRESLETEDSPLARSLWWQLSRDPLLWQRPFGSMVEDLAFSPDGLTLLLGCTDRVVYLVDTTTMAIRALRGHEEPVWAVATAPDGPRAYTGDAGGTVIGWELDSGTMRTFGQHGGAVRGMAVSPDGRRLASSGYDNVVRLWDTATGEPTGILDTPGDSPRGLAFSPDGLLLAGGSSSGRIWLWDLDGGGEPLRLVGHHSTTLAVDFHPDGERLISASTDGTIRVWDLRTSETVAELVGHTDRVWDAEIHPDGSKLVSASLDGTVRLWDLDTGEELRVLEVEGDRVYDLSISPDGRQVATTSEQWVRLWDLDVVPERLARAGHGSQVVGVSFSADGGRVASAGQDRTIRIWDVASGQEKMVLRGHTDRVYPLVYSPDGKTLASGSWDETVRLWDTGTGATTAVLSGHLSLVQGLDFAGGDRIVSCANDGTLRVWDRISGGLLRTIEVAEGATYDVATSPDGRTAACTAGAAVAIVDLVTGVVLRRLTGHEARVRGLAFGPRPDQLVSGSYDGTVRQWDPRTGDSRVIADVDAKVYYVDITPDGRRVGAALSDSTARIWDLDSGAEVVLRGHRDDANLLRFSRDGTLVAVSGDDCSVRLWSTADGRPVWRAPVLLSDPPEILTHRGWEPLDGAGGGAGAAAWRQRLEARARLADVSQDGAVGCAWTDDGALEIWDPVAGTALARMEVVDLRRLVAVSGGCAALVGDTARLYRAAGAGLDLAAGARALARDGDGLLVATRDRLLVIGADGAVDDERPVGLGVTAVARIGSQLALGFFDGNVEVLRAGVGGGEARAFDDTPSRDVTHIAAGPAGTLIAGFDDGSLGIWEQAGGPRLEYAKLHGPVAHLLVHRDTLYAASELGDVRTIDLSVFGQDYCALLRHIWDVVPVVWSGGYAVLREAPVGHECR